MRVGGLQQSDYGWLAVLGVVVVVELAGAQREQMLSHATVRYKATHPVLTTGVVLTTAAHLLGWLDPEIDPYHRTYDLLRFLRQKIHAATPTSRTTITGT
ncbi:Gp37 (modular protein) [uncultured Mycobacterium sp.]|uniref:Gp37 (Modular protein) n=1 Tax=uncultured Mycobacterium sp. TaxID=171292 RepID=A0A1Y5PCW7_9MYCO|nr:Gp37 (modular protein) [uncultured Mycobacterium sp.]